MYPACKKIVLKCSFVLAIVTLIPGCGRESSEDAAAHAVAEAATSHDGVPVRYEVHGTGKQALVFVHGWSCDRRYWEGQLEPFSQKFRVVTIDLAGHGESGLGREKWTIGSFGGDVAAVVEELDLDRVVLVGHSMGGDVIMDTARRLPGRVEGLVWVDTYQQLGSPQTLEQIQEFLAPFRRNFEETTRTFIRGTLFRPDADESLIEWVATDMSAAPREVALESLESSFTAGREITMALQELKLPVVAINPDYPPTDVESMERHGVEVIIMSGVSHFLMMEDPEGFNLLLMEAIERFSQ